VLEERQGGKSGGGVCGASLAVDIGDLSHKGKRPTKSSLNQSWGKKKSFQKYRQGEMEKGAGR